MTEKLNDMTSYEYENKYTSKSKKIKKSRKARDLRRYVK